MRKLLLYQLKLITKASLTMLFLAILALISAQKSEAQVQTLVHPGIAFTQADLNQLKANITQEPWLSAYNGFKSNSRSQLSYVMQGPHATVSRAPHLNNNAWINDMVAIHNLAFMYVFTGDSAYARKATNMLDAWAVTNTYWGGIENNLDIGDHAQDWGVAAEILRYTFPGWTAANTQHVENYFANVLFPTSFVPNPLRDQNKGAIQLKTALAASIFCNDVTRFNQALEVYRMDAGGGMRNSLPNGEVGDTGRDDHWQVQATALVWGAEVAWKQKVDMFSELNNRVLAIAELYHQYAFDGATMTYIPFGGYASYWTSWGIQPGGRPWGMTNIIHNAYNRRKGIPTPQTDRMRAALGSGTQGDFLYLKSSDTSTAVPLTPVFYPSEHVQPVSNLTNIDIGATGLAGSASYNNGIWTLKGAGNSTSNAFSFNFKKISGDAGLVIKVNSMSLTTGSSGVMLRESLAPGSRFWDLSLGAKGGVARHGQPKAPWWLKIERVNTRIFAYHSQDGVNWTNTSCWYSATGFPTELYLGFYTISTNTSLHNTATFSNVGYSQSAPTGSPEISSATNATTTIGLPFSYSINASANPTAYSVSGLPAGLSLDAATGIISGTPTGLGQSEVLLTATNTSGSGTATLILKVLNNQAPAAIASAVASVVNTTQIRLSWPTSANATSYSVKRSLTAGGPYTTIQAAINLTSFTDPSPAPEVNNYYVITALTGDMESGNSNEVFANVPPAIPGRPVATNQSDRINLAWDAVSTASSYKVKRGTASGGPYTTIATVGTNSYTDMDVTSGSPYYYVLSSIGATLESANSTEAFGSPGASSAEWSQTPLSDSLNLAANWTGNTLPVNPAILTFGSTTDSLLTNDLTDLVASRIQFESDANAYTISGNGLTLKNDLVNNSARTQTFTTPLQLTDQLSVNTGSFVLNGAISGTGSLKMNTWGTLTIKGNNSTYSGNTTIIRGTVVASGIGTGTPSNPTAGPFGTGKIILNGGKLMAPPDAALKLYNDIEVLPGTRSSLYEDWAGISLYGKLSGSGNVAHDANYYAGLNLYGDNSEFTGTFTTIFRSGAHRLRFMSPQSGSAKANWLLDANAPDCQNLSFKTGTIHFGSLNGRGYIRTAGSNSPVISIGALNSHSHYGGTIDALGGNLTVEKVGTGMLRMYGNQLYRGTTTVKKGKLAISNDPASGVFNSPIIVQEGALLGSGVIQSSATIGTGSGPGAVLEPGESKIGTLKVGPLIMKADATYMAEINLENGTGDKVTATSVTLLNSPVLSISSIAGTLPSGTAYTLIDNTGTLPIAGTFKDLPEMSVVSVGGYNFRITYVGGTGNDILLWDERATQTNGLASEMYYIKIAGTDSLLTKNITSNTPAFDTISADKNLQRWKIFKESNGKYKIFSIGDAPAGYNNYINENAKFGTDAYNMTLNTMNIYRNGLRYAIQGAGAGNGYWYADGNIIRTQQDSTNSSTPSSFPFELVLDIYYSLDVKLAEAKAVRDSAQTSTTQEAGKYPVEAKQNFSNTIDSTLASYGSLTTVDQVNATIIMLTTAISDFKKTVYNNKNQIADGSYYIKIPNSGLYWTKNGTNTPTFETINSDQTIQHWNITKQSNGLYKITCASSPSSFQNYINEVAQFGVNSYDATWNTLNIFFNGTTYAIQKTQKSGNGYWYLSNNRILAQGGTTNSSEPSSFPLELVLDIKYALDAKINEAKIVRDQLQNQTTTTQELGKYPLTKWESLKNAIDTAVSRYNTITSATEANTEVNNLDLAILSLKQSIYYKTNQLANGNYYIKIPNSESYWTKNTTHVPLFAALNTDRSIQTWNITKQSNGRYKISHVSAPNTSYQNYINENAQFGKNVYNALWNTMNVYFNGTTYAIQRAQNSGTGFWDIFDGKLGSGPSATTPTSFPILLVPVDGLQVITFNTLSNKTMGDADFEGGATSTSGLEVSYISSNPAVATIVDGKIHLVGSGTTNITASQAGNGTYSPATTVTQALTVLKKSQIITFNPLPGKTIGDADFDAAATASSGLAATYASSDTSVATIVNGKVHLIAAGTTTITASQEGNAEYLAASSATQTLTVNRKEQNITFAALAPKTLGDADFDAVATASSGLAVIYTSSDSTVATIVDEKVHLVGAGTTTITASQEGNEEYNPADLVTQTLTVNKKAQSITFAALETKTVGDSDFDPAATSSSELPVTYTSSNESVATIVDGKVHITGAGTTTITASQAGSAAFNAATSVSQVLTVVKKEQSISFAAIADKTTRDADFDPAAVASSALPVTYTSSNQNVATIVNGKVHLVGGGTTVITASQAGNTSYNAASSASQELNVFVLPAVFAKNIEVELNAGGTASITAAQVDNGSISYSGALSLSLDKTTFGCSNVGAPLTVTLTGTDAKGYSSSATAQVTVVDHQKPVLTAPSAQSFCFAGSTYILPALVATDNCGVASIAYTVSGATQRSGSGADASGVFNPGTSTVTFTVTDAHGNTELAVTSVTVNSLLSSSIPDVYAMNSSTDEKNTIYLGYGPSSLSINATANGGTAPYTYAWSTGATTASISVSAEGTYTATITDAKGCQTTSSIVIHVLDVRCGNNNDKVMVCHNGQTICVASSSVQAHLDHGDKLGSCNSSISSVVAAGLELEQPTSYKVVLYPNPASDILNIQVSKLEAGATIRVFNLAGVEVLSQRLTQTLQTISVSTLQPGVYVVQITNGTQVTREKVIKE